VITIQMMILYPFIVTCYLQMRLFFGIPWKILQLHWSNSYVNQWNCLPLENLEVSKQKEKGYVDKGQSQTLITYLRNFCGARIWSSTILNSQSKPTGILCKFLGKRKRSKLLLLESGLAHLEAFIWKIKVREKIW